MPEEFRKVYLENEWWSLQFWNGEEHVEFCKAFISADADLILSIVKRLAHSTETDTSWWPGKKEE